MFVVKKISPVALKTWIKAVSFGRLEPPGAGQPSSTIDLDSFLTAGTFGRAGRHSGAVSGVGTGQAVWV